jgi:hypothetical protein
MTGIGLFLLVTAAVADSAKIFELVEPKDRTVLYADKIIIRGQVSDSAVKKVLVASAEAVIGADNTFSLEVPLAIGPNALKVAAFDGKGRALKQAVIRVLRLATFSDLTADYWASREVEQLATLGIIGGYPDGTFRPQDKITRAEFAKITVRLKNKPLGEPAELPFPDVPGDYWALPYIDAAARWELITGYPDGTFRPTLAISRVEGVAVATRFAGLTVPESEEVHSYFYDISDQYWAVKLIAEAKEGGLLDYLPGDKFEPEKTFTRGEACWVLSRTKAVGDRIKALLDLKTGP